MTGRGEITMDGKQKTAWLRRLTSLVFAVILAFANVVPAYAFNFDSLPLPKATEDHATVSDEKDTATNDDPSMDTHFYMYIFPSDYGIQIHKIDVSNKQPVKGAKFRIVSQETGETFAYYYDDKYYPGVDETDSNGDIWFMLPCGDYFYQEVSPAPGYLPNTKMYPFTITDDVSRVEVIVENTPGPWYGSIKFWEKLTNGKKWYDYWSKWFGYKTGVEADGVGSEETVTDTGVTSSGEITTAKPQGVPYALYTGVVLIVAAIIVIAVLVVRKRKQSKKKSDMEDTENEKS